MPHRPAGWRMEPPVSVPSASGASHGRHRRRRAAAGAAGDAFQVPRVARHLDRRCSPWTSPWRTRPCSSCRSARRRPACRRVDDVGVVGRHEVLQDLAAAGGRLARGAEDVLDGDGHAGERAERLAALALGVHGAGLVEGVGFIDVEEGADLGFALADGLEELAGQGFGGNFARGERGGSRSAAVGQISLAASLLRRRIVGVVSSTAGTP